MDIATSIQFYRSLVSTVNLMIALELDQKLAGIVAMIGTAEVSAAREALANASKSNGPLRERTLAVGHLQSAIHQFDASLAQLRKGIFPKVEQEIPILRSKSAALALLLRTYHALQENTRLREETAERYSKAFEEYYSATTAHINFWGNAYTSKIGYSPEGLFAKLNEERREAQDLAWQLGHTTWNRLPLNPPVDSDQQAWGYNWDPEEPPPGHRLK